MVVKFTELNELLEKLKNAVICENAFTTMLIYMPERFKCDRETVHTAINKLAKLFPDLFGHFTVDHNWPYPHSDRLESHISRLMNQDLLYKLYPAMQIFFLDKSMKKRIKDEYLSKWKPNQLKQIREAAKIFKNATSID